MFVLAHADHPEVFFMGVIVGACVAVAVMAWNWVRERK